MAPLDRKTSTGSLGSPKFVNQKTGGGNPEDKKKKQQLILLAVLIPILLYLVISTFMKGSKPAPQKPQPVERQQTYRSMASVPVYQQAVGTDEEEEAAKKERWGSNPFSANRSDSEEVQKEILMLQGIVFDGQGSAYAVINEKIVKEGDEIDDNKIIEITQNQVMLLTQEGAKTILRS